MRWCLAALLMLAGCLAATQALAERRVALVVGNSKYEYTSALPNPRNDAEDIAATLTTFGFEVTVGYDLDQVKFAGIIDQFARALEGADVGLFFYAGHGLQINDKNYLVSTQAKLESTFLVPSETIELDAIIRLMESKTGTNLIFLDACRNNPLTENLKRNLAATNRALTVGRGLAAVTPTGRDTLVAFSAAPGELAADGTGRNSPFASALLRHMPQPGLEVSVMLKDVTADVRQETRNLQRPQQLSDMSKKFYFVKAEPAATPAAGPSPLTPQADPVELAFWQTAAGAGECESIRAYLRRYPNGRFEDLAVLAERRLCKPAADAGPPQPVIIAAANPAQTGASVAATPSAASAAPASTPTSASPVSTPTPASPVSTQVATAPVEAPVTPMSPPAAAPDIFDIGRKLQRELRRVGCTGSGMEFDGTWGLPSRNAMRSFIEATHSVAVTEQPTPEALELVQSYRTRACPVTCESGTEWRGGSCVDVRKERERTRHVGRPPERGYERERTLERAPRAQHETHEPRRAESGPTPPKGDTIDPRKVNRGSTWGTGAANPFSRWGRHQPSSALNRSSGRHPLQRENPRAAPTGLGKGKVNFRPGPGVRRWLLDGRSYSSSSSMIVSFFE